MKKKLKAEQLSPRIKRLRGIIKVEKPIDYKKVLTEELLKKYEK